YWIEGLSKRGVPCGPVNTIDKVFTDPQVRARGMVVEIPHAGTGKPERYIASPIKMSATPVEYRRAAPMVGEHTEEVLGELLGTDKTAFAKLRAQGVV
ncbi:MAG: CoA transferase, partial [Alphaproteobacteria bacterium]